MIFEKSFLEYIIKYTLSLGAEYIEINSIKKEKKINTISMKGKKTNIINEFGTSITVYYNSKKITISTSNINDLKKLCRDIKNNISLYDNFNNYKKKKKIDFELNELKSNKIQLKFDCFNEKEYLQKIKTFCNNHSQIVYLSVPLLYEKKETCIANSNGEYLIKNEYYYKIDILMSALLNGKVRFNYFSKGNSSTKNLVKSINIEKQLNDLFDSLKKMKSNKSFKKRIPVVLASGIGGVVIHESCGHSLESREIIKKKSVLNNYSNINNPILTVIDNPTVPNLFGSLTLDDEGNETHKVELIKNGKINDYLLDNEGNRIIDHNIKKNCSGRRESYYNLMSSRMSNTYILPSNSNFNEIISSVKYGIYVKNIAGGVVDTISGNFSFNCLESYFIINGKIDYNRVIDNLSIIGNTIDMLKKISMIGNDLEYSCGICGSESGFIYTTVGQPTIKIEEMFVEG